MSKREYVYRRTPMRFEVIDRVFLSGSPFVHLKPIDGEPEGTIEVPWEDFIRDYSDEEPVPPWRPDEATVAEPAGLDDEAAAETAWGDTAANDSGRLPWKARDRSDLIAFARRFRDLTTPASPTTPPAEQKTEPSAPIDAEALARAAWQVAMRPGSACNEWSDVATVYRQHYIAFARCVIDAVAKPSAASPAVEQGPVLRLPSRYLMDHYTGLMCAFGMAPSDRIGVHFGSPYDRNHWFDLADFANACARWIADGRPAS